MKILLVENHGELQAMLAHDLSNRGFVVDRVGTAEEARAALRTYTYSAMVLDPGLPDGDGLALVRERNALIPGRIPTVIVTARDSLQDRIASLNAGADDYLVRPFHRDELEARLRAVLRRPAQREVPKLELGSLSYDPAFRTLMVRNHPIDMTRRESDLLEALLRASGRAVVRDILEEQIYPSESVTTNALEALVSRLRRALAKAGADVRVVTQRGIGYQLVVSSGAEDADDHKERTQSR